MVAGLQDHRSTKSHRTTSANPFSILATPKTFRRNNFDSPKQREEGANMIKTLYAGFTLIALWIAGLVVIVTFAHT